MFPLYLVIVLLLLAGLVYVGWRVAHAASKARPKSRVIGPDDDPEFLWRLSQGDDSPKP